MAVVLTEQDLGVLKTVRETISTFQTAFDAKRTFGLNRTERAELDGWFFDEQQRIKAIIVRDNRFAWPEETRNRLTKLQGHLSDARVSLHNPDLDPTSCYLVDQALTNAAAIIDVFLDGRDKLMEGNP